MKSRTAPGANVFKSNKERLPGSVRESQSNCFEPWDPAARVLLSISKMILQGVDWAFQEVPRQRGHSHGSSNKQPELQQSRQKKKIDGCPVEQNRQENIYKRVVDVNSVTYFACVRQRLALENFGSDAGESQ